MKIKAGYKTSEFWFTMVSFVFSGLYLTGILTENEQKEELITVVSHAVESCILIGGQLIILYRYVKGRSEIKKIAEEKIVDESKRTNNSRSRSSKPKNKRVTTKPKKSGSK